MNQLKHVFLAASVATLTATVSYSVLAQTAMNNEAGDQVFQHFGGKAGISKVIDDFLVIWQADPRISQRLADADVERLGALLKEQITQLTGGPAVYSGKDMHSAHAQMGLRNVDFNALAEDLQLSMEKNGIASRDQNKLLAMLAPMQKQIVTK
jgi:hemoglobin